MQPKTSAELASWYEKNFSRAIERVQAMTPEQLVTPVDYLWCFHLSRGFLHRLREQPQHPPSRPTRHLSKAYGSEGSVDLRGQFRRTLEGLS